MLSDQNSRFITEPPRLNRGAAPGGTLQDVGHGRDRSTRVGISTRVVTRTVMEGMVGSAARPSP